jgi:hypothetical protein
MTLSRTIRLGLALAAAGALFTSNAAFAADIGDRDLQTVQIYYQPTLMASIDEAIAVLNALHESYSDWRGGRPTSGIATKAHVDLHTNIHYTDTNSQWVPSWGGIIGPGGSYTPYMGGSTQTTQSERDEGADISVTPAQINQITLWNYPNLERDFKYGFDLQITGSDGKASVKSFRTSTIDIAHRLADAFATLAAANFTDGSRFTPSWGVTTKNVPGKFAKLGWTRNTGFVVDAVFAGSPAQAAGLAVDDVIFEASGQPVPDIDTLRKIGLKALNGKPSNQVPVKVFRGGQTLELTATLTDPNAGIEKLLPPPAVAPAPAAGPIHLGIAARALTPEEAKKAKRTAGVVIASVDKGSLAEQMAIQTGDILLSINGAPVPDMEALKKVLAAGGEVTTVTVLRAGKTLTLTGVSKM